MRVLKLQIAEIDCEPHAFAREKRANALVDGSLRSEADGVIAKDAEHRGPEKNLMGLRLRDGDISMEIAIGMFADEFGEQSPVPMIGRAPPLWRAVSVDEAVVEYIGTLGAGMFGEFGKRSAEPDIVAARSHAGDGAEHETGSVCRNDIVEAGLRAGHDESGEYCGLDALTDLRGAMLEAPFQSGVKIGAGLNA